MKQWHGPLPSLSARRAWIETMYKTNNNLTLQSLSARRAWIETIRDADPRYQVSVALRKEGVD